MRRRPDGLGKTRQVFFVTLPRMHLHKRAVFDLKDVHALFFQIAIRIVRHASDERVKIKRADGVRDARGIEGVCLFDAFGKHGGGSVTGHTVGIGVARFDFLVITPPRLVRHDFRIGGDGADVGAFARRRGFVHGRMSFFIFTPRLRFPSSISHNEFCAAICGAGLVQSLLTSVCCVIASEAKQSFD